MSDERICATCGRRIEFRARWARNWDEVRHCSERCRRSRPRGVDRALEDAIRDLLAARPAGATICPSEAAILVGGADWRGLMERTRRAARRLVAAGEIEMTQGGRPVDPSTARGPIRLRSRGVRA